MKARRPFEFRLQNPLATKSCLLAASLIFSCASYGQTWTGASSASWGTAANWSPSGIPASANTTDIIMTGPTRTNTYLAADRTIRSLTFDAGADTNGRVRFSTAATSGDADLTFDTNSGSAQITVNSGATGNWDIGGAAAGVDGIMILNDDLIITHDGSGILSFTRPITGDKSISVNGSGTTTFSSTAALDDLRFTAGAGILNITGTVSAKDQIQFTTGTVNVNSGGTLQYTGGDTATSDEVRIGTTSGSAATLNINNGGVVDTGVNALKFGQSDATSNLNLNSGGMLVTNRLTFGTGSGASINTVKLDGGEIKASSANADFLNGATAAGGGVHVHDGGVTFNSNGNDIGVAADLIHSTLSGAAATDGGITKTGGGTLTLTGASTYNGATLVSAGTLLVNGSLGASAVTVENGATFGGSGTIGSTLALGASSSFQVVDLSDALGVTGTITFGSGFGIANLLGIDWDSVATNTSHTIISTSQTFSTSDIANFGFDNRVAVGALGREAYFTNGSLSVVVIPEPRAALLGGLGMLALLRRRRTA